MTVLVACGAIGAVLGIVLGPVLDRLAESLVSYDDLPEAQKMKDGIFVSVVKAMALALDLQS
jgi:uncharacterized protein YqgC (DUF456 family)